MNQIAPTAKPRAHLAPRRDVLTIGAKKPPAPAAIAAPARLVPSAPRLFPLGKLMRAQENVRHTRIEEDCDQLADDIMVHGLLQSLIGYELDGKVEVVGGGRRLKALRIVKQRGAIDDKFEVPVLIRDVDEAVELSLAENLQQRTMSPVDEFFAFSTLMARGDTSPAELAKRFGFSERVVKQRLRMADLAPEILTALGEREITIDAAMAYATAQDRALQVEMFQIQAKRGRTAHQPTNIRHSLRIKGIDSADPLYRFVGAAIYERDGGTYEDDLFNEPGKDRVLAKPFLLETQANTMVDLQAIGLVDRLKKDDRWAPTIAGFVKIPDLRVHRWGTDQKMRPPTGFVLIEDAHSEKLWRSIRAQETTVHVAVGIDQDAQLVASPRYAFIPIAQKAELDKPALADAAKDDAQRIAAAREREIIRWSRRLAVGPFTGTPLEGRAYWPTPDDRPVAETIEGVDGFLVGLRVFVSEADVAAHRKAAIAHVEKMLAERAAATEGAGA